MNDFNDFSNENQTEYVNEETPRSGGWVLGLLIVALLIGGLIWFFLSGSAPALSPDVRILTQYEDDFVFGEYTRYRLLLSNQGQAPSLSRLTVMSTLSQDAIPETVSAPAPWSCTLQPHAVSCQASGIVSAGQSLPAIEITTKLPERKEDGSNGDVRICAAVNTLLDKDLSNNEVCEIVTLQQADAVVQDADEQNEDTNNKVADNSTSENEVSENDEPEGEQPESEQPESEQPESEQPESEQPESEQLESEQPEDEASEDTMAEEVPETEDGSTVEEPAAEDENTEGEDREDSDVASSEEDALSEDEVSSGNEATTEDVAPAEDKPTTQRTALVVQIGDQEEVLAEPNGQVVVPIELQPRFNDTVMTVATLEIRFDPTMVEPIACGENPDKVWEIAVCNPAYDNGLMRLSVLSTAGVSGANRIAEIEFSIIGSSGSSTPIAGTLISLVDENQEDISYKIEESLVVIE